MKAKTALIASISTVGIASMANAQTYTSTGGTVVNGTAPHVVDLVITDNGTIADLDVSMNWASHAWLGDIDVTLEHVGTGTVVQIFGDVMGDGNTASGDSSDLVGVYRFDDESGNSFDAAAAAVIDGVVAPGTYFPTNFGSVVNNNALSMFDGHNINGTWRLTIIDDFPAFSVGSLNNFSLHATIPAPGALALLGVAGLVGRRGRKRD